MAIDNYNSPLSEAICRVIAERGLKQSAVAQKTGFGIRRFNDMLNGRRIIKACDIPEITKALGITPNDLYGIKSAPTDQAS